MAGVGLAKSFKNLGMDTGLLSLAKLRSVPMGTKQGTVPTRRPLWSYWPQEPVEQELPQPPPPSSRLELIWKPM